MSIKVNNQDHEGDTELYYEKRCDSSTHCRASEKRKTRLTKTGVPQYSRLVCSGTRVECLNWWGLTMKLFLSRDGSWLIQVLGMCNGSWASAKCWNIFLSSKCDKYRVRQVLKPTSTEVWLILYKQLSEKWGNVLVLYHCSTYSKIWSEASDVLTHSSDDFYPERLTVPLWARIWAPKSPEQEGQLDLQEENELS